MESCFFFSIFKLNKICQDFGKPKCQALPFYHSFTGVIRPHNSLVRLRSPRGYQMAALNSFGTFLQRILDMDKHAGIGLLIDHSKSNSF